MWISDNWKDYELIDATDGERLERWGSHVLIRPDPQVIWKSEKRSPLWNSPSAHYHRSSKGGGSWEVFSLPEEWVISWGNLRFLCRNFSFKHTGLFPEQAVNWEWITKQLTRAGGKRRVLNLFAYTGGATIAAASAGAHVTHVDASKGMIQIARENARLSGLPETSFRYLVDDCMKFAEREIRRGHKYDAIIMDPPSYGRGPGGEVWKIEDSVYDFLSLCERLLSEDALFVLINSYTTGLQPGVLTYMLSETIVRRHGGEAESGEIGLPVTSTSLVLPCGASGRWFSA